MDTKNVVLEIEDAVHKHFCEDEEGALYRKKKPYWDALTAVGLILHDKSHKVLNVKTGGIIRLKIHLPS